MHDNIWDFADSLAKETIADWKRTGKLNDPALRDLLNRLP